MGEGLSGPHAGYRIATAGAPADEARGAVVLVHGRGGSAEEILGLADEIPHPSLAYLAPQANGNTWYPQSFLAPLASNQPHLSSALAVLDEVIEHLAQRSIPSRSVLLVGFSQGACLILEFVARHPRRYGGVAALTGGLIGPPERAFRSFDGDLAGTPVLLAAPDPDPHVPWARVEQSAEVLERLGAAVTLRRYPGMGHTINRDQVEHLRDLVDRIPLRERGVDDASGP